MFRPVSLCAALLAAATVFVPTQHAAAQPFVVPIGGVEGVDWSAVEYFDLRSGAGKRDYRGGKFTSDGNQGIDFLIPNFVAMDSGVPVFAAADGTVLTAIDGKEDRFINKTRATDEGNLVRIRHEDNVITTYMHLKKDSLTVEPGDVVVAGQQIALVGSSGASYWPHLYFEVSQGGTPIETLLQPGTWWSNDEPTYTGDFFSLLDSGLTGDEPTRREYADRPEDVTQFFQNSNDPSRQITLWAMVSGLRAGEDFEFRMLRPNGTEFASQDFSPRLLNWGFVDISTPFPRNATLGRWTAELRMNDQVLVRKTFRIVRGTDTGTNRSSEPLAASEADDDAFAPEKPGPRFVDGRSQGPTASYQAGAAAESAAMWRGADPAEPLAASAHLSASYAEYLSAEADLLADGDAELYALLRTGQQAYSLRAYLDAEAAAAASQDPAAFAAALDAYLAYAYAYYDR